MASFDGDIVAAFRISPFGPPAKTGLIGSAKPLRLSLDDDLVEFFPSNVLDLLGGRRGLESKGSELERSNGDDWGSFVSLLLMPG